MPKSPGGQELRPVVAPDEKRFPPELDRYNWSQADRERGVFRVPAGGRPYETGMAVTNRDGLPVTRTTDELLSDLLAVMTAMYNGMVAAELIAGDPIE